MKVHAYLAAGRGTRLRPLTRDVPKPMLPFLSEPMLCGWLRRLSLAGIEHVHLLIGPDVGRFDEALTMARGLRLDVTVHHEHAPLGSGGALREAVGTGTTPLLVINADVVTGVSISHLLRRHQQARPDATILAFRHPPPSDFGVLRTRGSRIRPGIRAHPHARIHRTAVLRAPVLIGEEARIGAHATVGPTAVVGRHAEAGAQAVVADAVLLDRASVDEEARVWGALVGLAFIVDDLGEPQTDRRTRVA